MNRLWPGLAVLLCLLVGGCLGEAPHSNPLDPLSEDFEDVGGVTGQVTGIHTPFQPLEGAEVRLIPAAGTTRPTLVGTTDAVGRFAFSKVPTGVYAMDIAKAGYVGGGDTVQVWLGRVSEKTFRLGGLPFVRALTLQTAHVSRWWPPPQDLFSLTVEADVDDRDGVGDVVSVQLELPGTGFVAPLVAQAPGRYTGLLAERDLPSGSLHALMGVSIHVRLQDQGGLEAVSEPQVLARIIDATPLAGDPQSGQTITVNPPTLTWTPVRVAFPFTHRVRVARVDAGIETVVWSEENIAPQADAVQVGAALAAGTYNWTVDVVDAFGNWSRSKPAGFIVP